MKMSKVVGIVAIGGLGLTGAAFAEGEKGIGTEMDPRTSQRPEQQQRQGGGQASQADKQVLNKLQSVSEMEIQAAQLAQERAQSEEVREFAKSLAEEHQDLTEQVQQTAEKVDVSLAAQPQPQEKQKAQQAMQRLQRAQGAQFDQQFLQMQVQAHERAISDLQRSMGQVQNPEVKQLAQESVGELQEHRDEAQELLQKMQGQGDGQQQRGGGQQGDGQQQQGGGEQGGGQY